MENLISAEKLKTLSVLQPWKAFGKILIEWFTVSFVICLASKFLNPFVYGVGIILIATRQHGLAILMHEASHYRLCQNKFWNDLLGNIFCAWPFFITVEGYRKNHLAHHKYLNTNQDPDLIRKQGSSEWVFPKTRSQIGKIFLKDLLLLNFFDQLKRVNTFGSSQKPPVFQRFLRALFYIILFSALTITGTWLTYALFWLIPMFTVAKILLRIRSIAEHFVVPREDVSLQTRSIISNPIERWLFCPSNAHYHIEHHLFPSVPFYNLPELHQELKQRPQFLKDAHVTSSYFYLLNQEVRGKTH